MLFVLPGVDLADRDVEACSDIFHCLVALGDDTHTLSNGLGCDWVVTSHHNNLKYRRKEMKETKENLGAVKRRKGQYIYKGSNSQSFTAFTFRWKLCSALQCFKCQL